MPPLFRLACRVSLAAALFASAAPALAQHPNLSDITGPNVSDITGPNVSDITGPNVSDITGTTNDARAPRALRAGLDEEDLKELEIGLGEAYDNCLNGIDCTVFYTLYQRSREIVFD